MTTHAKLSELAKRWKSSADKLPALSPVGITKLKCYAELLALLDAEPEWLPIESAPKDEKPILGSNGKAMFACDWFSFSPHFPNEGFWSLTECGAYFDDGTVYPTYWMPLPPLPKSGE